MINKYLNIENCMISFIRFIVNLSSESKHMKNKLTIIYLFDGKFKFQNDFFNILIGKNFKIYLFL